MMDCEMMGSAMGWMMPLTGLALLLLAGLASAALVKYLFAGRRSA